MEIFGFSVINLTARIFQRSRQNQLPRKMHKSILRGYLYMGKGKCMADKKTSLREEKTGKNLRYFV